jgi:hypothetical protein
MGKVLDSLGQSEKQESFCRGKVRQFEANNFLLSSFCCGGEDFEGDSHCYREVKLTVPMNSTHDEISFPGSMKNKGIIINCRIEAEANKRRRKFLIIEVSSSGK